MPKTRERIHEVESLLTKDEAKQLNALLTIWEKSAPAKTEKEKYLEKLIAVADTDAERKVFQTSLEKLQVGKTTNAVDLYKSIESTGIDMVKILRAGSMKHIGDRVFAVKAKDEKENGDSEDEGNESEK